MRKHAEKTLRIICWLLVALLLFQLVRAMVRNHPFVGVIIPAVPTLSADTNATPVVATNSPALAKGENNPRNLGANPPTVNLVTNRHATNPVTRLAVTNGGTNRSVVVTMNSLAATNSVVQTSLAELTNSAGLTNSVALTNAVGLTNADKLGTNGVADAGTRKKAGRSGSSRSSARGGGAFMPGMGMGQPLPELPPVVRARIDRIVDSELLGPVIRPQPMALLGIAGNVAFLRTASGQTGLVKEGDSLGDLKLLQIGINRVLVEQDGQQQELTIFSGMGGESLLTTPDNHSNETTNH